MDDEARSIVFANGISAAVANRALIRVVQLLAGKGILDIADLEELRNLHLSDFDAVVEEAGHPEVRAAVDGTRNLLDWRWQVAIRDAETPIPDLRTKVDDL